MKNKIARWYKSAGFLVTAIFLSVISFAQDKGIDVDINVKKESQWYQQPWVWVIGGAVFILLLVALLRSNSKSAQ